jgi:hypothetical protein
MSNDDHVEDQISNFKNQVINAQTLVDAMDAYKKFKDLVHDQQKRHWQFISEYYQNFEEGYFYNVLDRVINLNINEFDEIEVDDLAKFLLIDEELKNYCVAHIEMEGMVAALKYKAQVLDTKKDVIARALQAI